MDEIEKSRDIALLGLIADFTMLNEQLKKDLKEHKQSYARKSEECANYIYQLRQVEDTLRNIKATIREAQNEKRPLNDDETRDILEMIASKANL